MLKGGGGPRGVGGPPNAVNLCTNGPKKHFDVGDMGGGGGGGGVWGAEGSPHALQCCQNGHHKPVLADFCCSFNAVHVTLQQRDSCSPPLP